MSKFMGLIQIIPLSLLFLAAACTRPTVDKAQVSISVPQALKPFGKTSQSVSASDMQQLAHVSLNVTGPGLATIVKTWDGHGGSSTVPSSFDLTIDTGKDRLFQVLAVYKDPITQGMIFYYGSQAKTLEAATEKVEIKINQMGGSAAMGGHIMGRYFTTPTSGPTGPINILYQPGSEPKMIVDRSFAVNGWFSVFGLTDISLEYEVVTQANEKVLMFGQAVNLNSPMFDPNENSGNEWNRRVKAAKPLRLRVETDNTNTTKYTPEPAEFFVWGYWATDGAKAGNPTAWTSRTICKSGLTGNMTREKRFTPDVATRASQPFLTISNMINIGLTLPATPLLLDQTAGGSYGYDSFLGGTNETCPANNTQFSTWLKIGKNQVDGNGNDNMPGFRLPFKNDANNNFMQVSSAYPRVLTANLLPGTEAVFSKFRLYKKVGVLDDYNYDEPVCDAAILSSLGYVLGHAEGAAGTNNAAGLMTLTSNITAADVSSKTVAVLCPMIGDKMVEQGLFLNQWIISGGSSGAIGNSLGLSGLPAPGSTLTAYSCYPVTATTLLNGTASNVATPTTVTITSSQGQFYGTAGCTSTGMPSYPTTIAVGTSASATFYYNPTTTGTESLTLTSPDTSYYQPSITYTIGPSNRSLSFSGLPASGTTLTTNSCLPVTIISLVGGVQTNVGMALPVNAVANHGQFFSSPGCSSSGMASFPVTIAPSTSTSSIFYYRPDTAGSETLSMNTGDPSYSTGSANYTIANSELVLRLPERLLPNTCYAFDAAMMDLSHSKLVPVAQSVSFTLNQNGNLLGEFFPSAACTSAGTITATATIATGTATSNMMFFKTPASFVASPIIDTLTLTANLTTGPIFTSAPVSFPEAADGSKIPDHAALTLPTGTLIPGECYPVKIQVQNAEDVPVPVPTGFTVLLGGASAARPHFFQDPMCQTSLANNTANIMTSSFEQDIFVQFHGVASMQSLSSVIYGSNVQSTGKQELLSSTFSVSLPTGSAPYVYPLDLPLWENAYAIGSHESSNNTINFATPAGATVTCQLNSTPGDTNCQGRFSGGALTVSQADWGSDAVFDLQATNLGITKHYVVRRQRLFPGTNMFSCTQTITANQTNPTMSAGSTVCVNPGVTVTFNAGASMNGVHLVGSALGTSTLVITSAGNLSSIGDGGSSSIDNFIGNFSSTSSSGAIKFDSPTGGGSMTLSRLNITDSSTYAAILVQNSASGNFSASDITYNHSGSATAAFTFRNASQIALRNINIESSSTGISMDTVNYPTQAAMSAINIANTSIKTTNQAFVTNTGTYPINSTSFINVSIEPSASSSEAISTSDNVSFDMRQSVLKNANQYIFSLSATTAGNVSLNDNLFWQKANSYVMNIAAGSGIPNVTMNRNHFLYDQATGGGYAFYISSGSPMLLSTDSNYSCSTTASMTWAPGFITGGGSPTGSFVSSLPSTSNTGTGSHSDQMLCKQ